MTIVEKWNLLISHVQRKSFAKETEVQQLWENIFADADLFGYSRFNGEIDSQRTIHIGSYDRTVPDIIIRESINKRDLFVVELKQYSSIFDIKYKEQLFSYMRLLRLNIGVLICNKIYVFVLDHDDNEKSIEITFTKDNPDGCKFVELFSKMNYSENSVRKFIEKNKELKSHVQEIQANLQPHSVIDIIKSHLSSNYSEEEIEIALKNIQITISFNAQMQATPKSLSPIETQLSPSRTYVSTSDYADYYEEPQDIDYIIIKTSEERVAFCNGSIYEATRYAWNVKVEHVRQYKYVFGVIKGIVRGVYCVNEWRLVTEGESVGRYEFFGYDAPNEIANRFLGKRIPSKYSKRGLASPVLYKAK